MRSLRDEENGLWSAALRKGKYKLIWGQSKLLKQKVNSYILALLSCRSQYNRGKQNWPFFKTADFSLNNAISPTNLGAN